MTNDKREALIEEADAMYDVLGSRIFREEFRAWFLALRGQAHTPTDDEREAMRRIIAQGSYSMTPESLPYEDVAYRLQEAGFGFRRPVQAETTDDEREALAGVIRDADMALPSGALALAEWSRHLAGSILAAGFRRPVQGEPTDSDLIAWHIEQIEALRPFRRSSAHLRASMMHASTVAALRAAAAVQEGEPMSAEGHWCGPEPCPECGETHACICGNDCDNPADPEREFRDWITADFKAGKLGIENGWLVEYNDPCPSPCAGVYGCPPSCMATPLVDLWTTQRSDAEKRAEWEAEQGEPGWEYGTRRSVTDGWERGDRYGEHEYVDARSVSDRVGTDGSTVTGVRDMTRAVRRRKAGPWEPVTNTESEGEK